MYSLMFSYTYPSWMNITIQLVNISTTSVYSLLVCMLRFKTSSQLSSMISESESCSLMLDFLQPHGLWRSLWNSPGQNTGVGYHALLQGVFPTQGLNPGLPYCRWILYWATGELKSPCCTLQPENLFILHNWNFVPLDQHHSFPPLFSLLKKKNYLKHNHINNKVLLYSAKNSIQNLVINHNGKEYEKEHIYV